MNILFYVEPVSFRDNHTFLSPTMNTIRCIINANSNSDTRFGIATSEGLLQEYDRWLSHGGLVSVYRKPISARQILREFDYDRAVYGNALFTEGCSIAYLKEIFADIDKAFNPDVIISFTQNSILEQMSPKKLVLFAERGPVSTWNGRDNFYFEATGHQVNSILARRAVDTTRFAVPEETAIMIADRFRKLHERAPKRQDAHLRFQEWLKLHRKGRKVALIANQPHDSLLVTGATGGVGIAKFMMNTVDRLPSDWLAFATYHPDMGDQSQLSAHLSAEFPNFIELPPELSQFGADAFVDAADALITIGSKAAFPAALLGKKIVAHRRTMLAGLSTDHSIDTAPVLNSAEAGRLLAFLSHRYTIANRCLFEKPGYFLDHIAKMQSYRSKDEFLLDSADWIAESAERMLV